MPWLLLFFKQDSEILLNVCFLRMTIDAIFFFLCNPKEQNNSANQHAGTVCNCNRKHFIHLANLFLNVMLKQYHFLFLASTENSSIFFPAIACIFYNTYDVPEEIPNLLGRIVFFLIQNNLLYQKRRDNRPHCRKMKHAPFSFFCKAKITKKGQLLNEGILLQYRIPLQFLLIPPSGTYFL